MNRQPVHLEVINKEGFEKPAGKTTILTRKLNVWFHEAHILKDIDIELKENSITGIIGPSGGGKSTLIKSLNRMNDEIEGFKYSGEIHFNQTNIYSNNILIHDLRKQIGMIFQKPCIFPKSIFENVLFGVKHTRKLDYTLSCEIVEENLRAVSLWKEVSERLHDKAITLSIGQQQRLCIARALAIKPKIILMDEPTSALDPISTLAVEELIRELKNQYTIVCVTHNMEQARRLSDNIIFMCEGKLIEQGNKERFFSSPRQQQTKDYLKWNSCEC